MTLPWNYEANPRLDLLLERVVDVPRPRLGRVDETGAPHEVVRAGSDDHGRLRDRPAPGRSSMRLPDGGFPNVELLLDVIERERLVWTTVLGPGFRPNSPAPRASR